MCRPPSASFRSPTGSNWPATRSNTAWTRSSRVVLLIRFRPHTVTLFGMTELPHRAVISRLSADFAAMSQQLARASADLTELDRLLSEQPQAAAPVAQPQPAPYVPPAVPYWPQSATPYPPPPYVPSPPPAPPKPRQEGSEGWIGKALAVAGVAVTLIGVVLL